MQALAQKRDIALDHAVRKLREWGIQFSIARRYGAIDGWNPIYWTEGDARVTTSTNPETGRTVVEARVPDPNSVAIIIARDIDGTPRGLIVRG